MNTSGRFWQCFGPMAVCLLLFTSSTASAELKILPKWTPCEVSGERFSCYDFEQSKLLLQLDLKWQKERRQYAMLEEQLRVGDVLIGNMRGQITALEKELAAEEKFRIELTEQLKTEIEKKNEYYGQAMFGGGLPWIITGGTALLLTGVLIGGVFF